MPCWQSGAEPRSKLTTIDLAESARSSREDHGFEPDRGSRSTRSEARITEEQRPPSRSRSAGVVGVIRGRSRSAASGGEEQHEPGDPAVEYVEAGVVEEPFHLVPGIDAQPARPPQPGGPRPADARLLRRHQRETPAHPQSGGDAGE